MPLKIKSTSGSVTLDAQNVAGDQTLTVPSIAGGKTLLTTDGDGSSLTGVGVDGIVSSANATAITIDANENVGIGESAPTAALAVSANLASDTQSTPETVASFGAKAASTGSDLAAGSGTRLELKIPSDDSPYAVTGTAIASIKELGNETNSSSALAFYTSQNDTTLDEYMRITSDGRGLSQFTAKAWVNFDGTGTIATRDSHNVSSLTDHGTGDYSVNFDNSVGNSNYCVTTGAGHYSWDSHLQVDTRTTTAVRIKARRAHNSTQEDNDQVHIVIFGD